MGAATRDRLHQPYRMQLCPLLPALLPLAGSHGVMSVTLSGAGPAVLLLTQQLEEEEPGRNPEASNSGACAARVSGRDCDRSAMPPGRSGKPGDEDLHNRRVTLDFLSYYLYSYLSFVYNPGVKPYFRVVGSSGGGLL